jgi:hypothetical protein
MHGDPDWPVATNSIRRALHAILTLLTALNGELQ